MAKHHLASSQPVYLMGNVLRFQYSENMGAFLSLGAKSPDSVRFWVLIVFVGVVLIGMLKFVLSSQGMNPVSIVGASLVIGGGFSNFLDRLFRGGAVVDFMNIGVGTVRTGIFNLADVVIMVGMGILIAWSVFFRGSEPELPTD
jgi:signal peptidase II